jgi:polyisoprenoid-binding protein YceI
MKSYPRPVSPAAIRIDLHWLGLPVGWIKKVVALAALLLVNPVDYAADVYQIDPAYSFITFSVRHLGLSNLKGQFKEFGGSIVLNKGTVSEAQATIQVKSLDTGTHQRDDHFRGIDFFDATNYPVIMFESKHIRKNQVYGKRHNLWDGGVNVVGYLTVHGVTRELRFSGKQSGPTRDSSGNVRIGFEAKTNLKRKDYGITFHQVLETGALVIGEQVEMEINIQAIRKEGFGLNNR